MGGCQSRKAVEKEPTSAPSPRLTVAILQRLSSPRSATVIPDVDDDIDVEEANLTVYSANSNRTPVHSPSRHGPKTHESLLPSISPLSSPPDDDGRDSSNHNSHSEKSDPPGVQYSSDSSSIAAAPASASPWNVYSPDMSVYTSSPSSTLNSPATPQSIKRRGKEILPAAALQPSLSLEENTSTSILEKAYPLLKRSAKTPASEINDSHPMAMSNRMSKQGSQQRLRSAARSKFSILSAVNAQVDHAAQDEEDVSMHLDSIATIGPEVSATEIPEEEDPDAPSDEEEYHDLHDDEDEPGRLTIQTIRTKYIATASSPTLSSAPVLSSPTWTQKMMMADGETEAVHPQTLSHFHRMALQQKLHQKQINKQARADKLQERLEDVKSYKQLWKDFQAMQSVANEIKSKNRPRMPPKSTSTTTPQSTLTPPEKRIRSDSNSSRTKNSASKNVTARRSQRGVVRSNSFTLGDSSSWYFDFQGTDFAFEGKENLAQSSLSLLSETSLEVQKRLFAQKRMSRKLGRRRESKNRARSVGGGAMSATSSISSIDGDYGPVRRRRPSLSGMSAPAQFAGNSDVEITNIEVSFTSPSNARERQADDASYVSDLADDVSASQFRPENVGPLRRMQEYGHVKRSTSEALAKIEKRIQELNDNSSRHSQPLPISDGHADDSPVTSGRPLTADSPITASLLVDKFRAAAVGSSMETSPANKALRERAPTPTPSGSSFETAEPRLVSTSFSITDISETRQGGAQQVTTHGNKIHQVELDETPRIKNHKEVGSHDLLHMVSPEPCADVHDSFEELGQRVETSVLGNSLDESTIALLDDSASMTSKHESLKDHRAGEHDKSSGKETGAASMPQQPPRAHGSIATMSTEEFLRISEEANAEHQIRKELHFQMKESMTMIRKISVLEVSIDESSDAALLVTPEKERSSDSEPSFDVHDKVEQLERLADERTKNRMSLAHLRGCDDPSMAESSLLLADQVEAKVHDVLCKFREENMAIR